MIFRTIEHIDGNTYSIDGKEFTILVNPKYSELMKDQVRQYKTPNPGLSRYESSVGYRGFYWEKPQELFVVWDGVALHGEVMKYFGFNDKNYLEHGKCHTFGAWPFQFDHNLLYPWTCHYETPYTANFNKALEDFHNKHREEYIKNYLPEFEDKSQENTFKI